MLSFSRFRALTSDLTSRSLSIKKQFDYLYGLNPVLAALKSRRREMRELLLNMSLKMDESHNQRIRPIVQLAQKQRIKIKYLSSTKLEHLAKHKPHQNVVLKCGGLEFLQIKKYAHFHEQHFSVENPKLFLILDGVTDPQNFGSIIRSACFLGASGIIVRKRGSCPLSPAVSKVSAGAMEFFSTFQVKFLKQFLQEAGKAGWMIVTTDIPDQTNSEEEQSSEDSDFQGKTKSNQVEGAQAPQSLKLKEFTVEPNRSVMVVLGSEGKGVRQGIHSEADVVVEIEKRSSEENSIDSLNVGVAAALIIEKVRSEMML